MSIAAVRCSVLPARDHDSDANLLLDDVLTLYFEAGQEGELCKVAIPSNGGSAYSFNSLFFKATAYLP